MVEQTPDPNDAEPPADYAEPPWKASYFWMRDQRDQARTLRGQVVAAEKRAEEAEADGDELAIAASSAEAEVARLRDAVEEHRRSQEQGHTKNARLYAALGFPPPTEAGREAADRQVAEAEVANLHECVEAQIDVWTERADKNKSRVWLQAADELREALEPPPPTQEGK